MPLSKVKSNSLSLTTLTASGDASISGLTVGKGGGAVATNTAVGYLAINATATGGNNVAIGYQAATAITTGTSNVSVGNLAFGQNTTGSFNTAVGAGIAGVTWGALGSNTTGTNNTATGYQALLSNTTASNNTAVGYQAAYSNTTASNNTAVGYQASYSLATNSFTTTVGYQAGKTATEGYVTAVGYNAASAATTGFSTLCAIGVNALAANTTGTNNTAIGGYNTLGANTTGGSNVAVGREALAANTTGIENTAVGYQALVANTTASYNTAVGRNSLVACTTGTHNTVIGHNSGDTITTGTKNTILGRYNGNQGSLDIRTTSNNIVLSDGDGNPRQYINSSGNVYVGTYPPKYSTGSGMFTVSQLSNNWDTAVFGNIFVDCQTAFSSDPKPGIVFGIPYTSSASATGVSIQAYKINATSGDFSQGFRITTQANGSAPSYKLTIDGSGNIGAPTGTNIYNASDVRLKKNIQTLDNALDKINALRGVEFNWIDNFCEAENNKTLYGFVAQEVKTVDENLTDPFGPTEIKVDDLVVDNPIRVNEKFIVPLLVNAIKELKTLVDAQKAEFDAYKLTHP